MGNRRCGTVLLPCGEVKRCFPIWKLMGVEAKVHGLMPARVEAIVPNIKARLPSAPRTDIAWDRRGFDVVYARWTCDMRVREAFTRRPRIRDACKRHDVAREGPSTMRVGEEQATFNQGSKRGEKPYSTKHESTGDDERIRRGDQARNLTNEACDDGDEACDEGNDVGDDGNDVGDDADDVGDDGNDVGDDADNCEKGCDERRSARGRQREEGEEEEAYLAAPVAMVDNTSQAIPNNKSKPRPGGAEIRIRCDDARRATTLKPALRLPQIRACIGTENRTTDSNTDTERKVA
ncbi:hypothetical protein GGG16DRAFT_104322 [Schizophyllum commune]